jgi:hypothetical protein
MLFTRLDHDRFIQGRRAAFVVLADKDAEQYGLLWDLHG